MRKCLFCPSTADSKEHAWPAWLLRFLDPEAPSTLSMIRDPSHAEATIPFAPIEVRWVCERCNRGWMSDLEASSKGALQEMMRGERTPINSMRASLIATWAMKSAMVWDAVRANQQRFYTPLECAYVREHRLPPSGVYVWVGCMEPAILKYTHGRTMWTSGRASLLEGAATTFVFGHLIIQVLLVRKTDGDGQSRYPYSEHNFRGAPRCLAEIWPGDGTTVVWPPPQSVTALDELEALACRFGPKEQPTNP